MAKFDFLKFAAILSKTAPLILSLVPGGDKIQPYVPLVVSGIQEAEQIPGASGEEKKRHVLNVVVKSIEGANLTGKVTVDSSEVVPIVSHGIDAVIGTINLVHGSKATAPSL